MASNIFEYKIKLSGDSNSINSEISRVGAKLLQLTKDEYMIHFGYDGNIKELNKQIDEISKIKGLNLPIEFKYDLNKKALDLEKEKLEKLNKQKNNVSDVVNFDNIKSEIIKAFGYIDSEVKDETNSLISKLNEKKIGNTVEKIFNTGKNSLNFQKQIDKILGLLKYAEDHKIDLFDENNIKIETPTILKKIKDLLEESFNSLDASKIFTDALMSTTKFELFDDKLIEDQKSKIQLLEGILSNIEKKMSDIKDESKNTKLGLDTSELDESLEKFSEKIKELIGILQQVPKEIKEGIVEPLDNAFNPEIIDTWKNNFLNALQEIKNDDFFKLWQLSKSDTPSGNSALSKLSNILNKIDEADRIISRKYSQDGLRERGLGISSQTGYVHGEYTFDKKDSYSLSDELVKDAREVMNEIIDVVLHTHPNGLYYNSESDIHHDVNEALFGNLKYGLSKGSGKGIQLFDVESFIQDFEEFFKTFDTKGLAEFFEPFKDLVKKYKEDYYESNYEPPEKIDLLNLKSFVSSIPELTAEEKAELDKKAKDYAMKKLLEAFGQDTSNFNFNKYFKDYSSNEEFIKDNPLGLSDEGSPFKIQELIEIRDILSQINQLISDVFSQKTENNSFTELQDLLKGLNTWATEVSKTINDLFDDEGKITSFEKAVESASEVLNNTIKLIDDTKTNPFIIPVNITSNIDEEILKIKEKLQSLEKEDINIKLDLTNDISGKNDAININSEKESSALRDLLVALSEGENFDLIFNDDLKWKNIEDSLKYAGVTLERILDIHDLLTANGLLKNDNTTFETGNTGSFSNHIGLAKDKVFIRRYDTEAETNLDETNQKAELIRKAKAMGVNIAEIIMTQALDETNDKGFIEVQERVGTKPQFDSKYSSSFKAGFVELKKFLEDIKIITSLGLGFDPKGKNFGFDGNKFSIFDVSLGQKGGIFSDSRTDSPYSFTNFEKIFNILKTEWGDTYKELNSEQLQKAYDSIGYEEKGTGYIVTEIISTLNNGFEKINASILEMSSNIQDYLLNIHNHLNKKESNFNDDELKDMVDILKTEDMQSEVKSKYFKQYDAWEGVKLGVVYDEDSLRDREVRNNFEYDVKKEGYKLAGVIDELTGEIVGWFTHMGEVLGDVNLTEIPQIINGIDNLSEKPKEAEIGLTVDEAKIQAIFDKITYLSDIDPVKISVTPKLMSTEFTEQVERELGTDSVYVQVTPVLKDGIDFNKELESLTELSSLLTEIINKVDEKTNAFIRENNQVEIISNEERENLLKVYNVVHYITDEFNSLNLELTSISKKPIEADIKVPKNFATNMQTFTNAIKELSDSLEILELLKTFDIKKDVPDKLKVLADSMQIFAESMKSLDKLPIDFINSLTELSKSSNLKDLAKILSVSDSKVKKAQEILETPKPEKSKKNKSKNNKNDLPNHHVIQTSRQMSDDIDVKHNKQSVWYMNDIGEKVKIDFNWNEEKQDWDKVETVILSYNKVVNQAVQATKDLEKAETSLQRERSKQNPNQDIINSLENEKNIAQNKITQAERRARSLARTTSNPSNSSKYQTKFTMSDFRNDVAQGVEKYLAQQETQRTINNNNNQIELDKQTKKAIENYKRLIKVVNEYYILKAKEGNSSIDLTNKELAKLKELETKIEDANNQTGKYFGDVNNPDYNDIVSTFKNLDPNVKANYYEKLLEKSNPNKYVESYRKKIEELEDELENLPSLTGKAFSDFNAKFENTISQSKDFEIIDPDEVNRQMAKIGKTLYDSSGMPKNLRRQFEELNDEYKELFNSNAPKKELDQLNSRLEELLNNLHQTGYYSKSVFVKMGEKIRDAFAGAVTRYLSFYDLIRYGRELVQVVTELDSALTQFKIVSSATSSEVENISQKAYELATNLGSSTVSIVESITDWRRLGKTIEESMILAEQSAKLATGGLMEVGTATEAITSSLQAFDISIDDTSKMVDQFIYLGNNYAITSEELATSLEKSSAALVAAGNTIEQAQAMEVAGNTILQDSDAVANAIKVLSMRLRGTKASELEKAGEDTEGLIENASKLYNTVKNLTKTQSNPEGVSIINKMNGEYKSTYEILRDISKVWGEISDVNQAALLEVIAGKVRASSAAAILQNGDILESAYEDALYNSEGAGTTALETSLDSIEKKVTILQNKLKRLGQNIIESDTLKSLVDFASNLVDFADNFDTSTVLAIVTGLTALVKGADFKTIANAITGIPQAFKNFTSKQYDFIGIRRYFRDNSNPLLQNVNFEVVKKYLETKDINEALSLKDISKETEDYLIKLDNGVVSLKNFRTEASRFKSVISSLGVSLAISGVIFALTKVAEHFIIYNKLLIETGKNAVNTFNEQQKSIDDYKSKIQSCYDVLNDTSSSQEEINRAKFDLIDIQGDLSKAYGIEASDLNLVNSRYEDQIKLLEKVDKLKNSQKVEDDFHNNVYAEKTDLQKVLSFISNIVVAPASLLDFAYTKSQHGSKSLSESYNEMYQFLNEEYNPILDNNSLRKGKKKIYDYSNLISANLDEYAIEYINNTFKNIKANENGLKLEGNIHIIEEELNTLINLSDNLNINPEKVEVLRKTISDIKQTINDWGELTDTDLYFDSEKDNTKLVKDALQSAYDNYKLNPDEIGELYSAISTLELSGLSDEMEDYIKRSVLGNNKDRILGQYNFEQDLFDAKNPIIKELLKGKGVFSIDDFLNSNYEFIEGILESYKIDENTLLDILTKNDYFDKNQTTFDIVDMISGRDIDKIDDNLFKYYADYVNSLDWEDVRLLIDVLKNLDPRAKNLPSVNYLQKQIDKLKESDTTSIDDTLTGVEAKVSELTSSLNSAYDAYQKLLNPNISSEELLNSIIALNKASKELETSIPWEKLLADGKLTAQELSQQIDAIANIEKEKMLDAFNFDSMSPETQDVFKPFIEGLVDAISNEKKAVAEFQNMNSEIDKLQSSFSSLGEILTTVNSGKALTLDQLQSLMNGEENYIEMLTVENGQLVINTDKYREKVAEQLLSYKAHLDDAAAAEINALAEGEVASGFATATAQIVENTGALGSNTTASIVNAMNKGVSMSEIKGVVAKYNTIWNKAVKGFQSGFGGFMGGGSSGGGSDNKGKYKELLDAEIKILDGKLEMSYINFKDYIQKRRDLIEKYYADGLITAKEYYQELGDMYQAQLAIYDRVIRAVVKVIDDQIKVYQKEQEAIDKQIESLQKANEERQDAIDLQKKLYELERARSQKTRLVYRNGQLQYLNDPQSIRDAQTEVDSAILNKKVKELEKQKDEIQKLIDALEEYKEKWQEIADIWDNMKDAQLAEDILGPGWKDRILALDPSIYENFKNDYVALESMIDENAIELAEADYSEIVGAINSAAGAIVGAIGNLADLLQDEDENKSLQVVDPRTGRVYGQFEGQKYRYDEYGNKVETEEYKQAQRLIQELAMMTGHTDFDIQEKQYETLDDFLNDLDSNSKSIGEVFGALEKYFEDPYAYIKSEDAELLKRTKTEDTAKVREAEIQKAALKQQEENRKKEEENLEKQTNNQDAIKDSVENIQKQKQKQEEIENALFNNPIAGSLMGWADFLGLNKPNSFIGKLFGLNDNTVRGGAYISGMATGGVNAGAQVALDIVANDKVTGIIKEINDSFISEKEVPIVAEDEATPVIDEVNSEEISDKTVMLDADSTEATATITEVDSMPIDDKPFDITTSGANASKEVETVDSKKIKDKSFIIKAIDAASSIISTVTGALSGIIDKVINITAHVDMSSFEDAGRRGAEIAAEAAKEETKNNNPPPTPSVPKTRTTKATGTFSEGNAYARGTNGTAGYKGEALVGELGQELRVRNGMFELVGKRGAEFVDVRPDDIIFNASQTKALLKYGKINTRGKAFADGTDFTPLSTSDPKKYEMLNSFVSKIHTNTDIMKGSILNIDSSIQQLTKQIGGTNMLYKPTEQTPIINITNPMFQCTGVTGEEVLHQIERSFEGLFLNAYQQSSRK